MLRSSLIRATGRGIRPTVAQRPLQWQISSQVVLSRSFADKKPAGPIAQPLAANPSATQDVKIGSQTAPNPAAVTPTLGVGTAAIAPPPSPPPKTKRTGRLRRFFVNLIILSTLGYGIGVYYALTSDNWHDFFTEYIPFGEDVVAYFEEREFRRRLASRPAQESRLHPQIRGEAKVTIPSRAGATVKNVEPGSDLGSKGRHSSAVEPTAPKDDAPHPQTAAAGSTNREPQSAPAQLANAKSESQAAAATPPTEPAKSVTVSVPEPPKAEPAILIDNIGIENATEPVVQDLVKILNNIITVINADNAAGKYASTIDKAKGDLTKIVSDIGVIRDQEKKATEDKLKGLHSEFDTAARELIRRTEQEMKDMEMRWMEEYENERGNLSKAYDEKLRSELSAANDVHEQKVKNELLKQAIALRREFSEGVKQTIETERDGRLSKLDELSSSVSELERLTSEWNSVVDSTMSTQHLMVAVEAVRATLENSDRPKPFIAELAALKEVASDNPVVNAAIASVNPSAYQRGISTTGQLVDRFRRVANEVRKAALLPENSGVMSMAASYVLSQVMFKKDGLPVGDDVESILTRTEVLLEEGNLEDAVREMNGLKGWAKVLSGDWLGECRRVLEVQQALDIVATEARLRSLLVE